MKHKNFSDKVYEVVKQIPKGKVLTYKQVAEKMGNPKAYRAVGSALKKNKDSSIPCHRVIRTNGDVGGYNGLKGKKIPLLQQEGVISLTSSI
jgi:O-6-methylguanine DNA methyltransferase